MSVETLFIILLLALLANAIFIWLIFKRVVGKPELEEKKDTGLNLLLQQMHELTRTVDSKIGESSKQVNESMRNQFSESSRLIREVTASLTKLDETNKQVVSFADQLQSLQDILKNPKQRGIVGEYYLETLLKNVLPPGSYQMQYAFKNGDIVDAVVFVKDKVIPIDSKFSLENYNKIIEEKNPAEKERLEKVFVNDLKNRISETAKYIRPTEDTMDFAFMFIPHEAIYYDLLINKVGASAEDAENLIQRAAGKYKVIIVSPTSFLAYLQTVLQGLKAMQIEDTAKDIVKHVGELGRHLKSYNDYHKKMGNALSTTVNHFNASSNEFKKIDKDVMRITEQEIGIKAITLEKPEIEE
ncbi:DNA recombination protein RmuC [Candidatus Parcubacteria bacterium]|nr:DNA recombination protein RmuC [Candidatus Parcubacteria bacterium]